MKLPSTQPDRPVPATERPAGLSWLLAVVLALATIAVYWPILSHNFVNYDDNTYVRTNTQVQGGLSLENIKWAFTHTVGGNWHPLTMLSHMLDCQLYGLKPWGHHLTSLLFHAADATLLLLLLQRLTGAVWRSAWVAAMFAFHPLHVESVAWIAERKDVLSTFFGFAALLFYARYALARKSAETAPVIGRAGASFLLSRDYWLACIFFALGLLCKPMLVTWPLVLLLLDFWPLDRFQTTRIRSLAWEKSPFFLLAMASGVVTFLVQRQEGAVQSLSSMTMAMRWENTVISYCRYVMKLFGPVDLAVYYPFPKSGWPVTWVLGAIIFLTGLSVLFWLKRQRHPFLLMGWLWFLGTLVPVIGLVQVGSQAMADRYTYIPSVGIFIAISWGAYELSRRWRHQTRTLAVMGSVAIILGCGMTRRQAGYWTDSETLFRHTLAVTVDNDVAHCSLGFVYYQQGRTNAALDEFKEAIRINPNFAEAHRNLGLLLGEQGQTNLALGEFQLAVQLNPSFASARYNLGCYLIKTGQMDEGIRQFKETAHFRPEDQESCQMLLDMLLANGQTNAAISQLQEVIKVIPSNPEIHYRLGNLFSHNGQTEEAVAQFQETIRLKPGLFEAHNNLGNLLSKMGQSDQAIIELKEAIRLKPDLADAHYNLGVLYMKKGMNDGAIDEFQTAIRLSPNLDTAHYYLGNVYMKGGQMDLASAQFQEAIRINPDHAFAHNKLGIALGSMGRVNEAIAEFQTAVRLKPDYAEANTNLALSLKLQGTSGH